MFLHIGSSRNIRTSDVIGIFDMDTATVGVQTKRFLSRAQRDGRIVNVSDELPKSFLVTGESLRAFPDARPWVGNAPRRPETVYLAQLAPQTLAQRSEQ